MFETLSSGVKAFLK